MSDECPECGAYRWTPCDEDCTVGLAYEVRKLRSRLALAEKLAEAASNLIHKGSREPNGGYWAEVRDSLRAFEESKP